MDVAVQLIMMAQQARANNSVNMLFPAAVPSSTTSAPPASAPVPIDLAHHFAKSFGQVPQASSAAVAPSIGQFEKKVLSLDLISPLLWLFTYFR